ncbi:MAG: 50S ribosomal protein L30 [Halobacteria archaeon]|nr:50S ribosomal protein L30 [Halobacteria archaeon]
MYGVVQVRSGIDMSAEVRDTLEMLNLGSPNRFTLVPETESYEGMILKVNDCVAYGNPDADTVEKLLRNRATTHEGDDLTQEYVEENTQYGSVGELAEAIVENDLRPKEVGIEPSMNLHPPRKGHSGIKQSYKQGGALGNHGDEIDDLLRRMR